MCHAGSFMMDLLNISNVTYVAELCEEYEPTNLKQLYIENFEKASDKKQYLLENKD